MTLVNRPGRPEIRSARDAHHQNLISIQGKMRDSFSGTRADRAAEQGILRRSVAAFRDPGQGFLAAAKTESQRNLIHIGGVPIGQRRLAKIGLHESLCENHLLTWMSRQMCSVIFATKAGEGLARPGKMANDVRKKFVAGAGGGRLVQW